MYCSQCAEPNPEQAKFCRACGGELSLMPQALSGRVPEPTQQLVTRGIATIEVSTALLLLAIAAGLFLPAPVSWAVCFVMALIAIGLELQGITRLKKLRDGAYLKDAAGLSRPLQQAAVAGELGRGTGEVVDPVSVTEDTTELLEARPEQKVR